MKNSTNSNTLADLVEGLQSENLGPVYETIATESSSTKSTSIVESPNMDKESTKTETLDNFLSASTHSILKCEKVTYIDPKIHEVLLMIKQKRGVPIGILLSFLAKEFIVNHKSEIKTLFAQNDLLK